MERIPPSERIRKELRGLLQRGSQGEGGLSEFLQKGMQLLMQELLEAEVTEYLDRGHYERRGEGNRRGHRNGYKERAVKTAEGEIQIGLPQVRDTEEPYISKLKVFFGGNTDCLEKLTAEMYARGLSTRDIEDALYEATGDQVLSKSSVSRVTEILWQDYEEFRQRDLSGDDVEYLFVDAVYESVRRLFGLKEALLAAWGVRRDGSKVLLSLRLGNKERYEDWLEVLRDLVKRGMRVPVAVTSDGAPGLIKAIEAVYGRSLRLRCWFHRMQNLAGKVPPAVWPEIKAEITAIRDASSYQQGKELALTFIQRHKDEYPSLVTCLTEDLEASLAHLKLPVRHRKSVRTTNLIERSFEEERRRTKVIPGFFTEKSCLKLVFSVLVNASKRWRRIPMDDMELKRIDVLRQELGLDQSTTMKQVNIHKQRARG